MNLKERALTKQDIDIVGKVQIDYTDPLTGRVKERISDHNHVFLDAFNITTWRDILNLTTNDNFFMTDDNTPPTDEFQYLRGKVVGWGRVGAGASGLYRGNYISSESLIDQDIDGGKGRRWKYVYSFADTQVPSPIRSIGISMQYNSSYTGTVVQLPNKFRNYTNYNTSCVTRGDKCYSIADTGIITVYDPFNNTTRTIDISAIVGSSGRNLSIGMADDTERAYIMAYSTTAAQRQMYEFTDETFTTRLNTYAWSNLVNIPTTRRFVTYGDEAWWYHGGGRHGNFKTNVNPVTVVAAVPDAYNTTVGADNVGSIMSFDGKLINTSDYNTSASRVDPIWDMANDQPFAYLNSSRRTSTATQGQTLLDPSSLDGHKVILFSNSTTSNWVFKQAMTCYALPDDAPERPDNAGIKIMYQIDVNY